MATLDVDTLDFNHGQGPAVEDLGTGLTILAHPDLRRVGEVALLLGREHGGTFRLSRTEPLFGEPGARQVRPLAHPVVSRQPLTLSFAGNGVRVEVGSLGRRVQMRVGDDVSSDGCFTNEDVERGVLIDLSGCVLLLLHRVPLRPDAHAGRNDGILGQSPAIAALRAEVARVADSSTGVLIRGETGTGKELVARALHRGSARRNGPYLAVNMAAIPESTAASALFGHQRGAFTSAHREHRGYFGEADGGTVFLDEIGETPKGVQGLLLRALREGEVQPVGSAEPRPVDVRVLAATDAALEELVEAGRFSEALLRRLEAYTLWVPALRQRPDDVARLFVTFLESEMRALGETKHFGEAPVDVRPWLPASFVASLVLHRWPGNVAELQTMARRVAIANRGVESFRVDAWCTARLEGRETPSELRRSATAISVTPNTTTSNTVSSRKAQKPDLGQLDDRRIAEAMRKCRFIVREAAEQLGVSRSWLHTRLEFCSAIRQAKDLDGAEIREALNTARGSVRGAAELLQVSEHGLKLRMKALEDGPT